MNPQTWLAVCQVASFLGALIVVVSGIGVWFFGSQIEAQKDAKISELIQGKNDLLELSHAYVADLRTKEAALVRLDAQLANMQPVLSIIEVVKQDDRSSAMQVILGTTFPVEVPQAEILIEFSSEVLSASRSVRGNGSVACNFEEPRVQGNLVMLSGGPLGATCYLFIEVETNGPAEIVRHNLRVN